MPSTQIPMSKKFYGWHSTLDFGKFKGKTVGHLISCHPEYVRWLLLNVEWFAISKKHATLCMKNASAIDALELPSKQYSKQEFVGSECEHTDPEPVYFADGSGYYPASGPAGPLYFDEFGNT